VDEDEMSTSTGDFGRQSQSSANAPAQKKSRSTAVSVKDYVAPDVSGLSKREARLVKNRAAAFLSRQRKREEFEEMQVRVGELEEENARLKREQPKDSRVSHLEQENARLQQEIQSLRAQVVEATAKTIQVFSPATTPQPLPRAVSTKVESPYVKIEDHETDLRAPRKSLALVVLLCALPALLALPHAQPHNTARPSYPYHGRHSSLSSMTFPLPATASYMDTMDMDPMHMDIDSFLPHSQPTMQKQQSMPLAVSVSVAGGLDLALSFDDNNESTSNDDGRELSGPMKIHIQPGSSPSSEMSSSQSPSAEMDPFLTSSSSLRQQDDLDYSDMANPAPRQRRVRITPVPGPSGQSEWSVEVDPC
jgi:hypothetical protein